MVYGDLFYIDWRDLKSITKRKFIGYSATYGRKCDWNRFPIHIWYIFFMHSSSSFRPPFKLIDSAQTFTVEFEQINVT